ncbi:MAG: dihydrofolate reductase [Pelovirga sp.]
MISLIAAMAHDRVIGQDGTLPWHLPDDLHWFRRHTMGQVLLMGRRTFEAIGRALPGRHTLVVSRQPGYQAPGCQVVPDISAALDLAGPAGELFVCGGGDLYQQLLPRADRLYLTEVDLVVAGDTFFPVFDAREFDLVYARERSGPPRARYLIYQRKPAHKRS